MTSNVVCLRSDRIRQFLPGCDLCDLYVVYVVLYVLYIAQLGCMYVEHM
jgi:hypothetical protein